MTLPQRRAGEALFSDPIRPLTQPEAAAKMGLTVGAFKMRICRLRRNLTPEQRANFKRAVSRSKRRVRAGSYSETSAAA